MAVQRPGLTWSPRAPRVRTTFTTMPRRQRAPLSRSRTCAAEAVQRVHGSAPRAQRWQAVFSRVRACTDARPVTASEHMAYTGVHTPTGPGRKQHGRRAHLHLLVEQRVVGAGHAPRGRANKAAAAARRRLRQLRARRRTRFRCESVLCLRFHCHTHTHTHRHSSRYIHMHIDTYMHTYIRAYIHARPSCGASAHAPRAPLPRPEAELPPAQSPRPE